LVALCSILSVHRQVQCLRCRYCISEPNVSWMKNAEFLSQSGTESRRWKRRDHYYCRQSKLLLCHAQPLATGSIHEWRGKAADFCSRAGVDQVLTYLAQAPSGICTNDTFQDLWIFQVNKIKWFNGEAQIIPTLPIKKLVKASPLNTFYKYEQMSLK
jgi:hypothetical protein